MKKIFFLAVTATHFLLCYQTGKHLDNAIQYWQAAHDVNASSLKGHFYRSLLLYNIFEFELALRHINEALHLSPQHTSILKIKGEILQWLGKYNEALSVYNQLLALTNNKKEYNYGLYSCLTALGKLPEAACALQDWRRLTGRSIHEHPLDLNILNNKSILIIGERAFGDQIQYIRLTSQFKNHGAKHITYATHDTLIPLLSSCPYVDRVISVSKKPYPDADYVFNMDELLFLLQITLDSLPNQTPYLYPNENLIKTYKQLFTTNSDLNIGICWQAKQGLFHELSPYCNRTTHLNSFKELSALPNIRLYSLQKGPGTEQLQHIDFFVQQLPTEFDTNAGAFVDTAAFMCNLDLIITVDTSIAHLAGALGKKVWVMLPYTADVRWMFNCSDTPWYPSMRLFRQKNPGNWDEAVQEIKQSLVMLIRNR